MPIYWEQSASGVQKVNLDTKEDDEGCEIWKPQMKNVKYKKHIINPVVNIVFIFYPEMNNNCKSVRFGMQRFKDDMSSISVETTVIFVQSLVVTTLALGLQPRQGLVKVRAKREAQESHLMLLGM